MASKEIVNVHNTLTNKYSEVPRFIFEHPVYGQYMELVVPDDVPCGCPESDSEPEPEAVVEIDPEPADDAEEDN